MLLLIWADEKYNTQKNPCVVFATQKNPGVFYRPKKIPFGRNVRPKKIVRTPPSSKYVSGAPGACSYGHYEVAELLVKVIYLRECFSCSWCMQNLVWNVIHLFTPPPPAGSKTSHWGEGEQRDRWHFRLVRLVWPWWVYSSGPSCSKVG